MQDNLGSSKSEIENIEIKDIKVSREENIKKRVKLVFFVKQGLDSFLGDIIEGLSEDYDIKKVIAINSQQIDEGMKWADICWFEWCDELIAYGSKHALAYEKKIICRVHSYEAFTNYINNVNWDNVDKAIFVAEHIRSNVLKKVSIGKERTEVIYNGINLDNIKFKEREVGFNIAYVGYINYKKGPMLLLHTFKAIYDKDNRYKLYIAGQFQDERYVLYYQQMIKEFGLENNIIYEGWQDNLDKWLEDKNYILCTSVLESQNMSVMQAMSKGIKPVIHNFVGASRIYSSKYLWNTIDEAVNMITVDKYYNSMEYRKYVKNKCELKKQIALVKNSIEGIINKEKIINIVKKFLNNENKNEVKLNDCTLLITSFNRLKILNEDLFRGFKFGLQDKLIVDDCSTVDLEERNSIIKNKKVLRIEDIIIHEINKGSAEARNTGFKNIKTLNTIVLDDDDMLLCIDKNKMKIEYNKLAEDAIIVVPRYIVNLYENGQIEVAYDRKGYGGLQAKSVLKDITVTSEIKALLAGAIVKNSELIVANNNNDKFIISEDFIALIKLFANNLNKKVVVSENYVHVRRINSNSLSRVINEKRIAIGLIAQCVGCYYCVKNEIIKIEDAFEYMRKRGSLIQQIYKYGEEFIEELIAYLNYEIKENIFVKYLNTLDIKVENSVDEICLEINLMKKLIKI
ncbi:Glycosyl transferases group 1 [Clostridium cavendishii DSM 21758]|uniref:Glycosyl transferases group 1 n=1 Tax=Clostridium cavendishii DSM 21758 TaxID=1121302 RepID=A0A1M6PRW1_9CLOT|nr:glycosyltransferase [Clostridium cavendishii]SHK10677.1 Glycosyl transferases group 1 [Clostridium cavendishii DSM 21758]